MGDGKLGANGSDKLFAEELLREVRVRGERLLNGTVRLEAISLMKLAISPQLCLESVRVDGGSFFGFVLGLWNCPGVYWAGVCLMRRMLPRILTA